MAPRGAKGHILVHVLITAVIIAMITAGIARMLLTRYYVQQRATEGAQNQRWDVSGVNRVLTIWAQNGIVCSAATTVGYNVSGGIGAPYTTAASAHADCKVCPGDTAHDAAMTFSGVGGKLCVESPNTATGGYTPDTSDGGSCPAISCP